jgi:hypothetical protein
MAIIYSYPMAQVETSDLVIGTKTNEIGEPTKSFLVSELVNLAVTAVTANGASGSFITNDEQTVVVVNGIITSIT